MVSGLRPQKDPVGSTPSKQISLSTLSVATRKPDPTKRLTTQNEGDRRTKIFCTVTELGLIIGIRYYRPYKLY